jgi:hypothetical protein
VFNKSNSDLYGYCILLFVLIKGNTLIAAPYNSMTMPRKIIYTCFFLLLIPSLSLAQFGWLPGFIITQSGDTIRGFIENRETRSLVRVCHFRESEEAQPQIFSPTDILGYRFSEGRYFVSRQVDDLGSGNPVFLEFLVEGEVSFFHYFDSGSRYFIMKNGIFSELKSTTEMIVHNDRKYGFERKEYKGMLSYFLQDADMRKEIDRSELTPMSLINLAITYQAHVCPDEDCIVYEKRLNPVKIIPGFHTGFTSNKISFGGRVNSSYSTSFNVGFRLRFENVITWNENILFETGLNIHRFTNYTLSSGQNSPLGKERIRYNNNNIILSQPYWNNPDPVTAQVNIKTTALNIPLTVLYRLPSRTISPYAGVGFSNMIVLSQTKELHYYLFNNRYNKAIPNYHLGLKATLGSAIKLNNSTDFLFEISFAHTESLDINQMLRFNNNQFSLNFGVLF